jgi:hypothetical protein
MPVKPCIKNGKRGFKWGDQGKCYTGPGSKVKAAKQGIAAVANGYQISAAEKAELFSIAKGGKQDGKK